MLTSDGQRASQLRVARVAAQDFSLSPREADDIVDLVVDTTRRSWSEVCDEAQLTQLDRDQLMGRAILNDYISWDDA